MAITCGSLEVIVGTMYSGKTTLLLEKIKEYESQHRVLAQLFKPLLDDRYAGRDYISTHNGLTRPAIPVADSSELLAKLNPESYLVGIDEIQFFDAGIIEVCNNLAQSGKIVVVTGLPKDFRDEPFRFSNSERTVFDLLRHADSITYLKAKCMYLEDGIECGKEATRVNRFIDGKLAPKDAPLIVIGAADTYKVFCRRHYTYYV